MNEFIWYNNCVKRRKIQMIEELRKEKKKTRDKINKDYEDNRNMIANIFKEVVKK